MELLKSLSTERYILSLQIDMEICRLILLFIVRLIMNMEISFVCIDRPQYDI